MNRRDFLKGMAALGLAVPSTKLIFDLGANKRLYPDELEAALLDYANEKLFQLPTDYLNALQGFEYEWRSFGAPILVSRPISSPSTVAPQSA